MNALALASQLKAEWDGQGFQADTAKEAADMLRRQHEAIVKLREAITQSQECVSWPHTAMSTRDRLEQALKDTENL